MLTIESLKENKEQLLRVSEAFLWTKDVNRLENSHSLQTLPQVTIRENAQNYLRLSLPIFYVRTLAKIRVIYNYNPRMIIKDKNYKLDST